MGILEKIRAARGARQPGEVPGRLTRREMLERLGGEVPAGRVPLGVSADGVEFWEADRDTHLLMAAGPGGGMAVARLTVVCHALERPSEWEIVACDPRRIEFGFLRGYRNVRTVAQEPDGILAAVREVEAEVERRFEAMREAGVGHLRDLDPRARRLLLMVDEPEEMAVLGDAGAAAVRATLERVTRLGRAAMVHLLLATTRPDTRVLTGAMRSNITARLAAGRMSEIASRVMLGTDAATRLPSVPGRAMLRRETTGTEKEVQLALTEVSDLPPKEGG